MKENFSKRLQKIIKCSKEEAIRLGHSYVGSEHLLLALLNENEGIANDILDSFSLDYETVKDLVETGNTLKENGLQEIQVIRDISTRLIANKAALKTKSSLIKELLEVFN